MNFIIENARWLLATALLYFSSCFGQTFLSHYLLVKLDKRLIYLMAIGAPSTLGNISFCYGYVSFWGYVDKYKITSNIKIVIFA